jgi:hypothetical protein
MSPKKPAATGALTDSLIEASMTDAKKLKVRQRLSDPLAPGLRLNVYPEGQVAFSVEYRIPGILTRMHVKIGEWPDMPISEAREIAETVRGLGAMGIDVQLGLHTRLSQELKRDGLEWRPHLAPLPKRARD